MFDRGFQSSAFLRELDARRLRWTVRIKVKRTLWYQGKPFAAADLERFAGVLKDTFRVRAFKTRPYVKAAWVRNVVLEGTTGSHSGRAAGGRTAYDRPGHIKCSIVFVHHTFAPEPLVLLTTDDVASTEEAKAVVDSTWTVGASKRRTAT
ncbi:hypothetical protein LCGC14_0832610 [marine sediment metagenome]|uniref:Transposase IS4-like domain-containing protein n=1 Tax=marine sediment metagenome TaxID=412755 RepID=A0A0F9Q0R9_9ZZZZ